MVGVIKPLLMRTDTPTIYMTSNEYYNPAISHNDHVSFLNLLS